MESIEIKIARDYTSTPGPRYIKEGDFSGEFFRQKILYPSFQRAISEGKKIVVVLDETAGYGTSFLEESFGGLIREEKMNYKSIIDNLKIISIEEDYLIEDVFHYIEDAEKVRQDEEKAKQKGN